VTKEKIAQVRAATNLPGLVGLWVPVARTHRGHRWVYACSCGNVAASLNTSSGLYHCTDCRDTGDCFTWLQDRTGRPFTDCVLALEHLASIEVEP
jgi:hypothetical protein